jgi:hypothetical protein
MENASRAFAIRATIGSTLLKKAERLRYAGFPRA